MTFQKLRDDPRRQPRILASRDLVASSIQTIYIYNMI